MATAAESILGRAKIPISGDLVQLDKDLSEARGRVGRAIDGIVGNVKRVGAAALTGVGLVGGAASAAAAGLAKLAIDAAPVEGLRDAFEGLAESSGSSMDEMLSALQRGSSGMISQRDLMMSYNKAAQLVSTTFAGQLPEAMSYLSKVSASTGQDMGFLLDSLVTGVGRVSPMILDNLGIQVSLAEATDRAAQMFGVEAKALDKTQIQAGLMNVVLEKLAANTGAMPDVADSAAAGLARMKATVQDLKDRLGLALLPALGRLLNTLDPIIQRVLPKLADLFERRVVPIIEGATDVVGKLVHAVEVFFDELGDVSAPEAFYNAILDAFGPDVAESLDAIVDGAFVLWDRIKALRDTVEPWLDTAREWISGNVELKDVLLALGIAVGAVVVPALAGIVAAAAPVVLAGAGLIAVVAGVRAAWETDFLGIRTFVEETFTKIGGWYENFKTNVLPKWKEKAVEAWDTAKTKVGEWWDGTADTRAKIGEWYETFKTETLPQWKTKVVEVWDDAKTAVSGWWNDTADDRQRIAAWFETLRDETLPQLKEKFVDTWTTARQQIEDFWSGAQQPLDDLKSRLDEFTVTILPELGSAWDETKRAMGEFTQLIQPLLTLLIPLGVHFGILGEKTGITAANLGTLVGIILDLGVQAILDRIEATVSGWADAMAFLADMLSAVNEGLSPLMATLSALLSMGLPEWLTGEQSAGLQANGGNAPAISMNSAAPPGGGWPPGGPPPPPIAIHFRVERMDVSSAESAEREAKKMGGMFGDELRRRGLLPRSVG